MFSVNNVLIATDRFLGTDAGRPIKITKVKAYL